MAGARGDAASASYWNGSQHSGNGQACPVIPEWVDLPYTAIVMAMSIAPSTHGWCKVCCTNYTIARYFFT